MKRVRLVQIAIKPKEIRFQVIIINEGLQTHAVVDPVVQSVLKLDGNDFKMWLA